MRGIDEKFLVHDAELRFARSNDGGISVRRVCGKRIATIKLARELRFRGIDVCDRHRIDVDAFEMNHAAVSEPRNEKRGQLAERRAVVERRRQDLTGLREKFQISFLFGELGVAFARVLRCSFGDADIETLREHVEVVHREGVTCVRKLGDDALAKHAVLANDALEIVTERPTLSAMFACGLARIERVLAHSNGATALGLVDDLAEKLRNVIGERRSTEIRRRKIFALSFVHEPRHNAIPVALQKEREVECVVSHQRNLLRARFLFLLRPSRSWSLQCVVSSACLRSMRTTSALVSSKPEERSSLSRYSFLPGPPGLREVEMKIVLPRRSLSPDVTHRMIDAKTQIAQSHKATLMHLRHAP